MSEKFSIKKAVSLTLAFSFLIMGYTGVLLFLTPKGKIAHWTDWTLLGLSKTQYTDLHITSMFLFLAAGTWHIYFNWKPLTSYLKNRARRMTLFKKELLLALVLNLFFVGGTLVHLPPFQSIIDLNEAIKDYWERSEGAPPFGHAEEATLGTLARQNGLEPDAALRRLQKQGLHVENTEMSLGEVAARNGTSAKAVYDLFAEKKERTADAPVANLGRRTLQELSEMRLIDLEKSLAYLEKQGFKASPQARMREAADALDTTPYALFETLKVL